MKRLNRLALAASLLCATAFSFADALPPGYPASYARQVADARKEGRLVVYSTTDTAAVRPLIRDFESLYPGIRVEYNDMNSTELYNRFVSEFAAGAGSADVLWSSAMDLQIKLVNDGFAASYASPETPSLPGWAHYQGLAYGTTYEPIAIVYNKRLLTAAEIPQTRADLARIVRANPKKFAGKITTYDIEKSGVGFNYLTQDYRVAGNATWDLVRALGATGLKVQSSTGAMLERISSGENLIGYNIIGSYALAKAKKDPSIGYVYPKDYTQVVSRLTVISKTARSPNAARLWTDYLLSKRGQNLLASRADLFAIRADVDGETSMAGLTRQLGSSLKPIPVGTGLLVYLDQAKRLEFLKTWKQALGK